MESFTLSEKNKKSKILEKLDSFNNIYNLEEIKSALKETLSFIPNYYKELAPENFFLKPKKGWTAEQNIKHLLKSTYPVAKFIHVRLRFSLAFFGSKDSSRSFLEIKNLYIEKLQSGKGAGLFTPFSRTDKIDLKKQEKLSVDLKKMIQDLLETLDDWKDEELENYCIIHPIIGNITVREMLFFTIYHYYHHTSNVENRIIKKSLLEEKE